MQCQEYFGNIMSTELSKKMRTGLVFASNFVKS